MIANAKVGNFTADHVKPAWLREKEVREELDALREAVVELLDAEEDVKTALLTDTDVLQPPNEHKWNRRRAAHERIFTLAREIRARREDNERTD